MFRSGTLTVYDASGKKHVFAGTDEPAVTIRLHDPSLHTKLAINPRLYAGEAYMDGTLTVEDGTIYDFLDLSLRNAHNMFTPRIEVLRTKLSLLARHLQQYNPIGKAQQNVAHHYDLSGALYDLFLDQDRQYSCAYYCTGDETLEEAQENKKRHIASKLLIEPGMKVLDIGSGWGGLGLYLAGTTEAEVTGVTLSTEQAAVSRRRAAEFGLADRAQFHLRDYRELSDTYDRIVSVGMFEHVGVGHYVEFFRKLKDLLADDGVALLHSIGRMERPGDTNPWIRKYIFPGGYTPAISEVMAAIEKVGLWVTDIEILRLHYADTIREWNWRFQENRDKVKEIYDERFCRMWEFYLQASEASFRHARQMVFQMQISKAQDAVPMTRDYVTDFERASERDGARADEVAA
jgi:cyclopropane-fatty-acyl-phospholipid synthase